MRKDLLARDLVRQASAAHSLCLQHRPANALRLLQQAAPIFDLVVDQRARSYFKQVEADALRLLHRPHDALEVALDAVTAAHTRPSTIDGYATRQLDATYGLARLKLEEGEPIQSLADLDRGIETSGGLASDLSYLNAHTLRTSAFLRLGKPYEAAQAVADAVKYLDSVNAPHSCAETRRVLNELEQVLERKREETIAARVADKIEPHRVSLAECYRAHYRAIQAYANCLWPKCVELARESINALYAWLRFLPTREDIAKVMDDVRELCVLGVRACSQAWHRNPDPAYLWQSLAFAEASKCVAVKTELARHVRRFSIVC